jgi:hypothetical protein
MVIIALACVLAVALIYFLSRNANTGYSQLTEQRPAIVSLGIQIICGDCAGEDGPPAKTYLDRHGNCSKCGGHSYMLAANRTMHQRVDINASLPIYDAILRDRPA